MVNADGVRQRLLELPKAELHLHMEGSMRQETANELADCYGTNPIVPPREYSTWSSFSVQYERCRALVGCLEDVRRIVAEIFEDAGALGTAWTELHLVPHLYHGRLGPLEGLVEAALDGMRSASRHGDGTGGLILAVDRNLGGPEALEIAKLAVRYHDDGVVAMGLTGDETTSGFEDFVEAFDFVRDSGLGVVPHSGEQGPASNVRRTIDLFRPDRICHGISAAQDAAIVQILRERQVCLDVAVTSNVKLKSVPALCDHPVAELARAGIPISLSADITLLAGSTIVDEYELAFRELGMSAGELGQVAANSLRYACAPEDLMARYASEIDTWVEKVGSELDSPKT
ncbi:MAG: adenosine deaminase family protein [Actinomycetota bacterium]|jgi:adenosine deaminase|nr:adenosine deaminase family protein [Actinomycetota bacterium]